jgi:flagellar basal body-associated protein FliL
MGHRSHRDPQCWDRVVIALIILLVVLVAVAVVIAAFVLGRPRRADGVAAFQRQIDALSPEARRPVVDQVQQLEEPGAEERRKDDEGRNG